MTGAIAVTNQQFGEDTLPIFIFDIACNGSEQRLLNCAYNTLPDMTCETENNDAGVVCQGKVYPYFLWALLIS